MDHMRSFFVAFCVFVLAISCKSEEIPTSPLAGKDTLTAAETVEYTSFLTRQWKDSVKVALQSSFDGKVLTHDALKMKMDWKTFGSAPAEGRALYISLHGGGATDAATNDGQWQNQLVLYTPSEGIYLCPRAIVNDWNMHFRKECDSFYEDVIRMAVVFLDVNPDKVYLMGYSAGGDGVWQLGPRMADHWAAASMMAGHPNGVSLVNLRNLPFSIWCGALDDSYNRNEACAAKIDELAALHADDPEGYVYEGHIVEGKPHWMDGVDRAAVPWMAQYKRNPYPKKVVWAQADEKKPAFYWLGIPISQASKGKKIEARIDGNTVEILSCDYTTATIYLSDKMMDLDKPVRVVFGERVLFEGNVTRSPAVMRQTLRERGDLSYIFPVRIDVKL